MDKEKIFFGLNLVFAIFFIAYSTYRPIYILDGSFYLFLVLALWKYHKALKQNMLSMSFMFIAIFVNNLGVFGAYNSIVFYDKALHLFSGVFLTYAFYLFLRAKTSLRTALSISVICALGMGALGEISEFTGYKIVPQTPLFQGGLLDPGIFIVGANENSIYTDTITDMISNLVGSILAALVLSVRFRQKASVRFKKAKTKI